MEALNHALFLALNAPAGFSGVGLDAAVAACRYPVLLLGALYAWACWQSAPRQRAHLWLGVVAAVLGLMMNYALGWAFPYPRPFMIGLGHTFLPHAAENSFPSDHATVMWTLALALLANGRSLWMACIGIGLAALTSWARIFLGVHFPFDILGSIAVSFIALLMILPLRRWLPSRVRQQTEGWGVHS